MLLMVRKALSAYQLTMRASRIVPFSIWPFSIWLAVAGLCAIACERAVPGTSLAKPPVLESRYYDNRARACRGGSR